MFQSFDFTAGVALAAGNALSLSVDGKAAALALETDWRPLAFSRTGEAEEASRPVRRLRPGRAGGRRHAGLRQLWRARRHGKWVLLWRGMPGDLSNERRTKLSRFADLRYKASVAKARGAAGVIFAPPPRESFEDKPAAPGLRGDLGRRRRARRCREPRGLGPHAVRSSATTWRP